jgi:hypothetical protein
VAGHLRPGVLLSPATPRRLLGLLVAAWAPLAAACPVCGLAASGQSQAAYIDMSIVISLVPLAAIGAIATWVGLRMRAASRAEAEEARRRVGQH